MFSRYRDRPCCNILDRAADALEQRAVHPATTNDISEISLESSYGDCLIELKLLLFRPFLAFLHHLRRSLHGPTTTTSCQKDRPQRGEAVGLGGDLPSSEWDGDVSR